jgi:hypothetical protein
MCWAKKWALDTSRLCRAASRVGCSWREEIVEEEGAEWGFWGGKRGVG